MVDVRSPFPPEEVPRIWQWIEPFRWRVSDDFSPKTLAEFITFYRAQSERATTWAVYRDGELGGAITCEPVSTIVCTAHCVFKKSFWGHETTQQALTAAFNQMFERFSKISSPVMQGNKSMLSLIAKMGGQKEGVLKRHTTRDGKPIDLVMTAFFKDTFGKEAAQ